MCGVKHRFADCPYLIPSKRPKGWTADPEIHSTIDEKIKNNERLRKAVIGAQDRAKEQKEAAKKPNSPPAAPTTADGGAKPASWYVSSFWTDLTSYRLKNCWTLDCGSSIHVCHDLSLLTEVREATEDDYLIAGATSFKIEAFGTA